MEKRSINLLFELYRDVYLKCDPDITVLNRKYLSTLPEKELITLVDRLFPALHLEFNSMRLHQENFLSKVARRPLPEDLRRYNQVFVDSRKY
jgi:hypothetical protein